MKRRATFRKSLASLLITTLVILGLLCSDIGPKTMAAEELSKEDELYLEGLKEESLFQRHAAVANGRIMNSFAYDEHGMWIFPEDYAGTYIDGEFLIVCLKEPDQESINYYLSLAEDEALFVQVKEVIYSQNELQLIADSQAAWFNEHGISVYSYWVDPQSNGISFLTAEADVQKARIEWDKKYPDISCHVEASEELTPTTTYLYGGDAIVNPSYSSTPFTLGACGTRYGSYAIITAGHACTATGQSIKKYGSSSAFSSVVQRSYP